MQTLRKYAGIGVLFVLAACGETTEEQALIGAGLGAGTALATDGNVAAGALIGAGTSVAFCNIYPEQC